jgi:diguanylate cyclase (GGDEF)-like protein
MLAVVDLDGMKRINDSYGHLVGDAILMRAARRLSQAVLPGELVARLGADEFVVLNRPNSALPARAAAVELGERCAASQ